VQLILWSILALGVAFGALYLGVRRAQRRLPPIALPPGEKLPTTALQRLAQWSLLAGVLLTLAAAAIVAYFGAAAWWDRDAVRLPVTGLLLAVLAVFTFYLTRVRLWTARDDGTLDERDLAILACAPAGQAPAMIVTLAAWMIGLVETYQATHAVPSAFLYLIFWSCLMVSILGLLGGVVIGYRRS